MSDMNKSNGRFFFFWIKNEIKAIAHAYELGVLSDQVLSEPARSLDPIELIVELEPWCVPELCIDMVLSAATVPTVLLMPISPW